MTQPGDPRTPREDTAAPDTDVGDAPAPPKATRKRRHPAIDIIAVGALLAALAYLHTRVVRVALVTTGSMMATVNPGDRMLIHLGAYKNERPRHGDVIAFWDDDHNDYEVKRVIATEGDEIVVGWGMVFLNGELLDEPYIRRAMLFEPRMDAKLGDDELFVMGDNRNGSEDSRDFGAIYEDKVLGR
ncbi:MAG TPA: signal peptidase I, partial [Armatimonadota bacterium]|nr:signal peptidase I [Armatimonadota bacterium]